MLRTGKLQEVLILREKPVWPILLSNPTISVPAWFLLFGTKWQISWVKNHSKYSINIFLLAKQVGTRSKLSFMFDKHTKASGWNISKIIFSEMCNMPKKSWPAPEQPSLTHSANALVSRTMGWASHLHAAVCSVSSLADARRYCRAACCASDSLGCSANAWRIFFSHRRKNLILMSSLSLFRFHPSSKAFRLWLSPAVFCLSRSLSIHFSLIRIVLLYLKHIYPNLYSWYCQRLFLFSWGWQYWCRPKICWKRLSVPLTQSCVCRFVWLNWYCSIFVFFLGNFYGSGFVSFLFFLGWKFYH